MHALGWLSLLVWLGAARAQPFTQHTAYGELVAAGGGGATLGDCDAETPCGTRCWHVPSTGVEAWADVRFDAATLAPARGSPAVLALRAAVLRGDARVLVDASELRGDLAASPVSGLANAVSGAVALASEPGALIVPDAAARDTPRVAATASAGAATLLAGDPSGSGVLRLRAVCDAAPGDADCVLQLRRPVDDDLPKAAGTDEEACGTRGEAPAALYAFRVASPEASVSSGAPVVADGLCATNGGAGTVYGDGAVVVDGDASEWPGFDDCAPPATVNCSLWHEDFNETTIPDEFDLHRLWVLVSDSRLCVRVTTYERLGAGVNASDVGLSGTELLRVCVQTTLQGPALSVCGDVQVDYLIRVDASGSPFTATVQDCGQPSPQGCGPFDTPVASAEVVTDDAQHFELCVPLSALNLTDAAVPDQIGVYTLLDNTGAFGDDFMPSDPVRPVNTTVFCADEVPPTSVEDDSPPVIPTPVPWLLPLVVVCILVNGALATWCCCGFAMMPPRRRCRDRRGRRRRGAYSDSDCES